ncbi:MAG TPA: BTAD domain-containing putative transcriptional regulator [Steroidobacteraceae bacterium]
MPALAKLTRPKVHRALPRERLFRELDRSRECPLIWVAAPPGSGKTTLVSSYIEARKLRGAWYQVDAGDDDVGTFFHYLAQTVPASRTRRRPLPVLSAAHRADLAGFSRHFFRAYFEQLATPALLALDNYHELPRDSALHGVLEQAVTELPQGLNLVAISRAEPPGQFTRLKASEQVAVIDWSSLRLSLDETREIAAQRASLDEGTVRRIHQVSDGWVAALTLTLARARLADGKLVEAPREERADLFDYFASQALKSATPGMRDFLLRSALLPRMTAAMAERLTGRTDSETLLEDLHRRGIFTDRRNTQPPIYQYHDLFREFLTAELERSVSAQALTGLQRTSGALLEEAGHSDHAIRLYLNVADWEAARRAIRDVAGQYLPQGRGVSVIEWIRRLPADARAADPWMNYWLGAALARLAPAEARVPLEHALAAFKARDDLAGQRLACAEAMLSFMFEYADFSPLDRWLDEFVRLLGIEAPFPSPAAELHFLGAGVFALGNRRPLPPPLRVCVERALTLLDQPVPAELATLVCGILTIHFYSVGDRTTGTGVVTRLRALLERAEVAPLSRAIGWIQAGQFAAHLGEQDDARLCFKRAAETAAAGALTLPVLEVYAQLGLAICALERGDDSTADECRKRIAAHWSPARKVDQVANLRVQFWVACHRRQWDVAVTLAERQLEVSRQSGMFLITFHCYVMLGIVYAEQRRAAECAGAAGGLRRFVAGTTHAHFAYYADLIEAYLAWRLDDRTRCHERLRKALEGSRQDEFRFLLRMHGEFCARLLAEALSAGIETEYAAQLVRDLRVRPPSVSAPHWPWPLRIFTLGRFEVLRDGQPLEFSRKAPKKTLALLKAIIAFGGRNVREQSLLDAFWSDQEGDVAARSLTAALHRLRALLGDGDAVVQLGGMLSLDPSRVWVDVWALEAGGEATRSEQVLALYRGTFLAEDEGEPWSVTMRERLRTRFIHALESHARQLEEAGRFEAAIESYLRGLDADPVIEQFYQGLMRCYARLDRKSEAIAAYRRVKQILSVSLSLKPSPSTEKLYQSLRLDPAP